MEQRYTDDYKQEAQNDGFCVQVFRCQLHDVGLLSRFEEVATTREELDELGYRLEYAMKPESQ